MNVILSLELEKFVNAAVESGRYKSVSQVVSAALELMQEQGSAQEIEPLQPRVDSALAALSRGEGETGEAYVETTKGELEESQEDQRPITR